MARIPYILFFLLILLGPSHGSETAWAQDIPPAFRETGLPLPRFVSLADDQAFIRTGPGMRYPVKWVLKRKGLPVEILLEFEGWRKIRDPQGQEGWVHQSLLSGHRTAILIAKDPQTLRARPAVDGMARAILQPGVVVGVGSCHKDGWCKVTAQDLNGWVESRALWGVYEGEEFD